jgi:hypothetical protein
MTTVRGARVTPHRSTGVLAEDSRYRRPFERHVLVGSKPASKVIQRGALATAERPLRVVFGGPTA